VKATGEPSPALAPEARTEPLLGRGGIAGLLDDVLDLLRFRW